MKTVAVFSYSNRSLRDAFPEIEAKGYAAFGFVAGWVDKYDYLQTDEILCLEYMPDVLEAWKAKAKKAKQGFASDIQMPDEPKGYEPKAPEPEKTEVDLEADALAAAYEQKFGKKPHHKMKTETILEKLNGNDDETD